MMNQTPVNIDQFVAEDLLDVGPECRERFLLQDDLPEFQEIDWYMGGIAAMRGQYRVGRRNPDLHTLLFTHAGAGELHTEGGRLDITPGSVTLMPAGQAFRFELGESEYWGLSWVLLKDDHRWQQVKKYRAGVFQHEQVWAVTPMQEALYAQVNTPRRRRLLLMLDELLQEMLLDNLGQNRLEMSVRQLFSRIEDQLHLHWTQQSLAQQVHCSVPHLNRICRRLYGRGPMSKVSDMRLYRARELLVHSNWQVSQIADRVGYRDAFNFSHWFRSRTGQSPTAYRRQGQH